MTIRASISKACFIAAASAALAVSLVAQQSAAPTASAENPVSHQRVACHGATTVPMTFDAEQSIPLKLVANLACGQEVAVLSDFDGYTVRVSTTEGLSGYVARAYLTTEPTSTPKAPQPATMQGR